MTVATPIQSPKREYLDNCPLRAGESIPPDMFEGVRRQMMLHGCKWDAQVEDVCTLSSFPLLMDRENWNRLATLAEALSAQLIAAENELVVRPELHKTLSVPRAVRKALREIDRHGPTPSAARVLRFDFHWTRDGWQISEVNSDVPGGFTEASDFPRLVAPHFSHAKPAGDPASQWLAAISRIAGRETHVALLCAAGFLEDQQVVAYMARLLAQHGIYAHLVHLAQLSWKDGHASLETASSPIPLAAIIRFYQAEWFHARDRSKWSHFFAGGITPVSNPGNAVLTESKRFPLVWHQLRAPMPAWRKLLPESRDPREVSWRKNDEWILKAAYCNTGDAVLSRKWSRPAQWWKACFDAWLRPGEWVVQKRFDAASIATPIGDMFPCVGVYTIDGRCAGAYARLSRGPVVDYRAVDVALLIEDAADGAFANEEEAE